MKFRKMWTFKVGGSAFLRAKSKIVQVATEVRSYKQMVRFLTILLTWNFVHCTTKQTVQFRVELQNVISFQKKHNVVPTPTVFWDAKDFEPTSTSTFRQIVESCKFVLKMFCTQKNIIVPRWCYCCSRYHSYNSALSHAIHFYLRVCKKALEGVIFENQKKKKKCVQLARL